MATSITDPWSQSTRFASELMQWSPTLSNAEREWEQDWKAQKARARELSSRDAYGLNSVKISQDALIGKHFRLSLKPAYAALGIDHRTARQWAQLVEQEWRRYAEGVTFDADARRINTFTFLMRTVVGSLKTDGEALAIIKAKPGHAGFTTCMSLIEPERLQDPTFNGPQELRKVRNGIERDDEGEPIAYHILQRYPGDYRDIGGEPNRTARVRRWNEWGRPIVLHLFDDPRPNMARGVSGFLAVAQQMKMLSMYSKAELERNIIQASLGAVIETEFDYENAMRVIGAAGQLDQYGNSLTAAAMDHMRQVAPWHERLGIKVNGSRVAHLVPGEKVHLLQPNGMAGNYEMFEQAMLRQFAAGLNVPYESLARNFSDTSYSAARMSLADIWRSYMTEREMVNQKFAMPFFAAWLEEAIVTKRIPMPDGKEGTLETFLAKRHDLARGRFISWTKPLIDPVKERTAQQMGLMMGLTTLEEETSADGEDYLEILDQRAWEVEYREEKKLNPLGFDPTIVPQGAAPPQQNAEGQSKRTTGSNTAE